MKLPALLLSFFLITNLSYSQDDLKDVQAVFYKYDMAVRNKKGTEAANYLDSHTMQYFKDVLALLRTADSVALEKVPVTDKFNVLMVRHISTKKQIKAFTDKTLVAFVLENGLGGTEGMTLDKIKVKKDYATATLIENGDESDETLGFRKESNEWKIDILPLMENAEKDFAEFLKVSGQTENEFIFNMLELMTQKKPSPAIWKP